jgi:S-adenosylmethionine:tRNA ribosyltransferase-isomerase
MQALPSFPRCFNPGDLLVLNDTRVIPARLYARRTLRRETGKPTGQIEVMLTEPVAPQTLGAPSFPRSSAERVGNHEPSSVGWYRQRNHRPKISGAPWSGRAESRHRRDRLGVFPVALRAQSNLKPRCWSAAHSASACCASSRSTISFAVLDRIGHMPLPPYIRRDDEARRTASATRRSSRANAARWPRPPPACTLRRRSSRCAHRRGVEIARITLHVGLGTFAPLRVERVDEVRLHRERYTLSALPRSHQSPPCARAGALSPWEQRWCARWNTARSRPPAARSKPHSGETEIFISPGFRISPGQRAAHQLSPAPIEPADAGERLCREAKNVLAAYAHAVKEKYRFFSYGDCMFVA